jgi:large subunit ribosomal protein L10
MKTKEQKAKQIEEGEKLLKQNKSLVFIDFSGASVEDLKSLRKILKDFGAKLKVIKKKLLRIVFERNRIDFNPEQFESQLGITFTNRDVAEMAGPIYKFFKELEKKRFSARGGSALSGKILGAYDLAEKKFIDAETVVKIGKLPTREVLLGQLVGILSAPMRMLAYVLNEKGRKNNH